MASEGLWEDSTPYASPNRTEGIFEAFLWQGAPPRFVDPVMEQLLHNRSEFLTTQNITFVNGRDSLPLNVVGFGIQCKVGSAVGNATLDPAHRTYSNFQLGVNATPTGSDQDLYAIQVQAIQAISSYNQINYESNPREANRSESTWLAAHLAIGLLPYTLKDENARLYVVSDDISNNHALTPENFRLAILKLLGEVIMDKGGQEAWYGNLYGLEPVNYLKPGIISWRYVFGMLAIWTLVTVSISIWMLFNKRWAPTLNDFELFKFGARYKG